MSIDQLREALKTGTATLGSKAVLRKLRTGTVKKIFLSSTCPSSVHAAIQRYTSITSFELIELPVPSTEVALLCKRNHPVSVLSF